MTTFVKIIALTVSLLTFTGSGRAQYFIDWYSTDAGGGTSSGGSYTISGTVGQPDAGTLTGGSYTLQGGFWPGLVVPPAGETPTLFIQLSGGNVIISWA